MNPIGNIGICAKEVCRHSNCFGKAHLNLNAAEHSRKAEDRGPIAGEHRPKRERKKVDTEEENKKESNVVFRFSIFLNPVCTIDVAIANHTSSV